MKKHVKCTVCDTRLGHQQGGSCLDLCAKHAKQAMVESYLTAIAVEPDNAFKKQLRIMCHGNVTAEYDTAGGNQVKNDSFYDIYDTPPLKTDVWWYRKSKKQFCHLS